jgi:hypothetical protein
MNFLQDRRALLALIVGVVVLIALGGLFGLIRHRPAAAGDDAPKGGGELKVVMGKSPKVEADTSVRCFVKGQFVGMETASACAGKNGVAPGALDVGLDQSGAIAAGGGDTHLQPLANAQGDEDNDSDDEPSAPPAARDDSADGGGRSYADLPPADCKAYAPGGWRSAGQGVDLDACVHTLFDGRCPTPGQVLYGHWGALTLRAAPGRIEISRDNRSFSPLAPQYPADCSVPPL